MPFEEIDPVVRTGFGPRFANLGPLESLDFCGLDNTPGVQPMLEQKVTQKDLGCKTGQGLFNWHGRDVNGPRRRRDQEFLRRLRDTKETS